MDQKRFCDEMALKLKELDRYFQLHASRSASTAETTMRQDERRPIVDDARMRTAALSGRLRRVCDGPMPVTELVRREFENELAQIIELLR